MHRPIVIYLVCILTPPPLSLIYKLYKFSFQVYAFIQTTSVPGTESRTKFLLFATFSGLLQVSQKTENEKKALNQKYEGLKDSSPVYEAEQILL